MDEETSTVESGDRSSSSPDTPMRGSPVQNRMSQRKLTRRGRKRNRRVSWKDTYVVQVLRQQLPNGRAPLSRGALAILHLVVKDLFDRIALEAGRLKKECLDNDPEDPVGPNEIRAALQILLPSQLRVQPLHNRFDSPLLVGGREHQRWR
ncbi:histone H2B.1, sperm-like [Monodelphis domestica]|uniref:histone H2B.1, sperm-like n=1 Tax=Monodelphis domestica TaxID=13616 RepID=UPI0004431B9C|nr:histone H2B.1, sperm-like [Monodelphis domestica]XP_044531130.1 histone H2B.1, sperm-like [Gracilinanus agilis]